MTEANQIRNRERLLSAVTKNNTTQCWEWRGQISNSGFGRIMLRGADGNRMESAHRASYEAFIGPIPPGGRVSHSCHNRLCINPSHLELAD